MTLNRVYVKIDFYKEMAMKPRNHVVLALLKCKRKQGAHGKSFKAMRRSEKVKTQREHSSIG